MLCPWMLLAVMSPTPLSPLEFSIARPPGPPPRAHPHPHPPPPMLTQVSDVARPTSQLEQDSFADGIHPYLTSRARRATRVLTAYQ